jgi:hypothetical protein
VEDSSPEDNKKKGNKDIVAWRIGLHLIPCSDLAQQAYDAHLIKTPKDKPKGKEVKVE